MVHPRGYEGGLLEDQLSSSLGAVLPYRHQPEFRRRILALATPPSYALLRDMRRRELPLAVTAS